VTPNQLTRLFQICQIFRLHFADDWVGDTPALVSFQFLGKEADVALTAPLLFLICCSSGLWAFSFGLGSQVVTHWLKAQGCSDTVVGLAHSFYYLGVAVGSCAAPWMTRRFGPARCATVGMIAAGMTLAAFPLGSDSMSWCVLRFLNGWASAMSLVPLETLVSRDSLPEKKTTNFAFYGVSLTIGGAIGISMGLNIYVPGRTLAFILGGSVPMIAGLILLRGMGGNAESSARYASEGSHGVGWIRNFLSYGTAWFQGFLEGGMLAFLSLFLIARGFSTELAGMLMSVTMIGVIAFQVPVGWLADRWGKTLLLLICYAAVALGLLAIPWLSQALLLALGLFVFGACTGAMYPLGLSLLGDNMPESALPRAYARYLAIECVGSQAGAAAMGKARDQWGEAAMFAVGFVALVVVLALWLALHLMLRKRWNADTPAEAERRIAA
jgi:MFS family permease